MFKGSKNVEPEQHTSIIASVGGESNAYTNEDTTVFWETVPAQYLPLALWLEADRMASLRVDAGDVHARARGGEGRAPAARREPAVRPPRRDRLRQRVHHPPLQAPGDRQHGRPRGGDASRTCATSTRPTTCRRTRRWSIVGDFDSDQRRRWCSATSAACRRRRSRCRATSRRSRRRPRDAASRVDEPCRCRPSSSPITSPTTATRTRYPLHIVVEDAVRRQQLAHLPVAGLREAAGADGVRRRQHHRGPEPVLRRRHRPAGAVARGRREGADRRARRLRDEPITERELRARQEPVRARLHRRPPDDPGQGAHAGARRRHPQRHQDRRRRVRHLPEHDGRRRAARRADLLHAGQADGHHDHAAGQRATSREASR